MNHDAIRSAYPNIVTIAGCGNFFDIDMNPVVADMSVIEQEAERMEAQEDAREALRQSMITKLAATLTPEETALLEELL